MRGELKSGNLTTRDLRILIMEGYKQISKDFGVIARLPFGKTGTQALIDASMNEWKKRGSIRPDYWPKEFEKWAKGMGEKNAASQYRRVYAESEGMTKVITQNELRRFRDLGGEVG